MEAHTFSRLASFFIDLLILSVFLSLLTFWVPVSDKYNEAVEKENKITEQFRSGEIGMKQFFNDYFENYYVKDKENVFFSVISVIISLGYFGTFAYYNNGQTLGKKFMKIKVVSNDGSEPSHISLISRALVINSVAASLLSCVIIMFITKNQYIYTIGIIQVIQTLILVISLFMVAFSEKKRGIHDLVAKTKVIQVE